MPFNIISCIFNDYISQTDNDITLSLYLLDGCSE